MLNIQIAKPCGEAWSGMAGDDRVRHCGVCRKNVYNVARMTETEIAAMITETEGRFCARVYRRADGRILTADCPQGVRRRRTLRVRAAFGLVTALLSAGCMGSTGTPSARETTPAGAGKGEAAPPRRNPQTSHPS